MSNGPRVSREEAEDALRRQDWSVAWDYWGHLFETGADELEWLNTMEAAALPHAEAGSLLAQQTLGSIGHTRHFADRSQVEPLHRSLLWIVAALRQEFSATGMQLLVEGYWAVRASGVRDNRIEAFLSEPEPRSAWLKWTGRDPLSDPG
jgi:hypothetical protein